MRFQNVFVSTNLVSRVCLANSFNCQRSSIINTPCFYRLYSNAVVNPQSPEHIKKLVPRSGLVDLVTKEGFKKGQKLSALIKHVNKSGAKLVVVNVIKNGDGNEEGGCDPQVVCKIIEKKQKKVKSKTEDVEATTEASAEADSEPPSTSISKGKARKEARLLKQQQMLEKQASRSLSRNSSKIKSLTINWTIAPNDFLSQKKTNLQSWLTSYHPVQIFLGNPKTRNPPTNLSPLEVEKRKILKDICIKVCEEVNAIEKKTDTIERGVDQDVLYYYIPKNQS